MSRLSLDFASAQRILAGPKPYLGFGLLLAARERVRDESRPVDRAFETIGYGLTSWSKLAADALAKWNAVGVGSGPDFGFFRITDPVVSGNACARDGVDEVRWAADNCGFSYGSAIAVTNRWLVNGARVEEDVIFNSSVAFNAYQGPLVGRQAASKR